jgi:hypothetical protein
MKMQLSKVISDVLFYFFVPIVIWRYGRVYIGEYLAMFFSAFSTIAYSIYKFKRDKQYNFTGLFVVSFILLNLFMNLTTDSALRILYNTFYLNIARLVIFIISIIISKPLAKVFYLDYRTMYGEEKDNVKRFINNQKFKLFFIFITVIFTLREAATAAVRYYFLESYGVLATERIIFYSRIVTYIFAIMIGIGVYYIDKQYYKNAKKSGQ